MDTDEKRAGDSPFALMSIIVSFTVGVLFPTFGGPPPGRWSPWWLLLSVVVTMGAAALCHFREDGVMLGAGSTVIFLFLCFVAPDYIVVTASSLLGLFGVVAKRALKDLPARARARVLGTMLVTALVGAALAPLLGRVSASILATLALFFTAFVSGWGKSGDGGRARPLVDRGAPGKLILMAGCGFHLAAAHGLVELPTVSPLQDSAALAALIVGILAGAVVAWLAAPRGVLLAVVITVALVVACALPYGVWPSGGWSRLVFIGVVAGAVSLALIGALTRAGALTLAWAPLTLLIGWLVGSSVFQERMGDESLTGVTWSYVAWAYALAGACLMLEGVSRRTR